VKKEGFESFQFCHTFKGLDVRFFEIQNAAWGSSHLISAELRGALNIKLKIRTITDDE
jgi:hypothetical protein